MAQYSIGIDVGGTFTDVTIVEMESGRAWLTKVESTPADPSVGFMAGLRQGAELAGVPVQDVGRVIHGTTVATNAVLERKPTRLALLTTEGFASVLEIGRHDVPPGENYYGWVKPTRPVTPERIFEVRERVDHLGNVLLPLDEGQCREVARHLRSLELESVAVCFLYSFLRPEHERRAAEIIAEECPELWVSTSSVVLPQFREFERSMATVLNAYVTPHVSRYLATVGGRLEQAGVGWDGASEGDQGAMNCAPTSVEAVGAQFIAPAVASADGRLFIMKSNGGVIGAAEAARQAIHTALSGPAGGVAGAARIAAEAGYQDVITIDVGGTSADVSLIRDGTPAFTSEGKLGAFPLQLPIVDIHTIGAGGGSIASLTSAGRLSVGPQSAGAVPGPVCYGKGGSEPTVTDAHLALGRIPASLVGGAVTLDRDAAERAIREKIAGPLGLTLEEAADGILAVVNASMVGAIRLVSIERGHDPRQFTLVPFGGAGPLHGVDLADLLGIPRILVPRNPGVLSTVGLLNADVRNDYVRTRVWEGPDLPVEEIRAAYAELAAEAEAALGRGAGRSGAAVERSADLRYHGQGFELTVEVPEAEIDAAAVQSLRERFHAAHERLYGYALHSAPVELVNLRVTATVPLPKANSATVEPHVGSVDAARTGERQVYFGRASSGGGPGTEPIGWAATPIYERARLGAGAVILGPAILEQLDSTMVLSPGQRATVDRFGNLIVQRIPHP
jgi:N-methylhydantoinase A